MLNLLDCQNHRKLPQAWIEIINNAIKSQKNQCREIEINGCFFSVNVSPHTENNQVHIYAQDISRHKELEDQLRQSQKMEAIGRLARGVAHDFNNLLTAINGYSELVLSRLKKNDAIRKPLEKIKKSGDRAANLTRQLLAFSRKQVLQPKIFNLNNIINDMNKMFRRLISEDIELTIVTDPDLGNIKADPGQLEQVILNLVLNARDALQTGGKITLETTNVNLDRPYESRHMVIKEGNYVLLSVSDNGSGMSREIQEKGTGMGLSTVYGIVKQSGGYILVYSEPNQGTSAKVYLPIVKKKTPITPNAQKMIHSPTGSETVLLVEDEMGVREFIYELLKDKGYHVLEARHSGEAIDLCKHFKGTIHLMITDVVMPGMSGKELAKYLTNLRPEMKVLYMSGYTDDAIVHHGILEKGVQFIAKPFSMHAIANKIYEVLNLDKNRTNERQ